MATAWKAPGLWVCAGLWLAAATACPPVVRTEDPLPAAPGQPLLLQLSGHFPDKPTLAPSWSIPVDPLGFAPPGPLYLGQRNSLASLDFLGEDRLLFTFRVPALLHRTPDEDASDEREIRAVVLALPTGTVQAQASWMVHDRYRYLWMLHNGHFLLRDRNNLLEGDATLKLTPFLRFPGPLLTLGLDPGQQYLVTTSREPLKTGSKTGASASPSISGDTDNQRDDVTGTPDLVVRILHSDTGQAILVSRTRDFARLPINSAGYVDSLRGNGVDWVIEMNYFTGGSRTVGTVKSACDPVLSFISETEMLASACADFGNDALIAMTTAGDTLWIDLTPDRLIWPLVTVAANGLRFARESLYVSHSVNAFEPLGSDDIKGQWVRVFDAATGKVAFESPASPILDAGGNVAISPSGRRVAVLNAGAIQIFELPVAPPLPATPAEKPSRK